VDGGRLIGIALVIAGMIDLVVGLALVVPRVPPGSRTVVRIGLVGGAALLVAFGVLFLSGVL